MTKFMSCQMRVSASHHFATAQQGFSLLEILLTVVIIGILAAIGIPMYSDHLAAGKRMSAEISLSKLASALEKYYFDNGTYQNAKLNNLGFPTIIDNYKLSIDSSDDENFQLSAIPLDNNVKCGTLFLNSSGEKGVSGSENIAECW